MESSWVLTNPCQIHAFEMQALHYMQHPNGLYLYIQQCGVGWCVCVTGVMCEYIRTQSGVTGVRRCGCDRRRTASFTCTGLSAREVCFLAVGVVVGVATTGGADSCSGTDEVC